ncbi:phage tail protein [Aeromonas veronii]|uniref:phage tail protein n=1 Tax=Aeromonas veronii TaxID=654 RepID=UPI001601FEE5|nr:phage tail protein [Aeromonas veronii]
MSDPIRTQHDEQAPTLPGTTAPWWEDGTTISRTLAEPAFLIKGVMAFWAKVRSWLLLPLDQDPLTCALPVLSLIAWERGMVRVAGEPLELFRKRVKFAFVNAQDAGEVAGFNRIFERLGLGACKLHERQPDYPWDVILVEMDDNDFTRNQALIESLIQHYGRTCRRYRFQVTYPVTAALVCGRIEMGARVVRAALYFEHEWADAVQAACSLGFDKETR